MKKTGGLLMMVLLLFSFLSPTYAERYLVVSEQRLSLPDIQYLEQVNCGPIPNGRYWINLQNGMWGYEGHPRSQGRIADICPHPQ